MDLLKLQTVCQERRRLAESAQEDAWAYLDVNIDGEVFKDIPERNLALLDGSYWSKVLYFLKDSPVRRSSNQILSKLNSKKGILGKGNTEFYVIPKRKKYVEEAVAAEGLLNAVWRGHHCDRVVERIQDDVEIYGYGVVQFGWRYEQADGEVEVQREEAMAYDQMPPITPEVLQMFPQNPEMMTELPDEMDEDQEMWDTRYDDIFLERVSPRRFMIDPQATSMSLKDARYVIYREYVNINKVTNNKSFNAKQRKKITGGIYNTRENADAIVDYDDKVRSDVALVKLYHMWGYVDLKDTGKDIFQHVIFCEECDEPLFVEESPYDFGDAPPFPFRVLPGMTPDQDNPYPITGIEQVADLQLAYDEAFSQLSELRRRALRMYLVPRGSLDKDAIRKIEEARDNSLIEVDTALIQGITPYPKIPVDTELYSTLELIPAEITRGLGVTEYDESMTPSKEMTKAEALIIQQSGNSRLSMAYELQRELKADIAYCIICLYQMFADKKYSYITKDETGSAVFKDVNAENLRGINTVTGELDGVGVQFVLDINSDSKIGINKETQLQMEIELLQTLSPYVQAGLLNPVPMLRNILKTANIDNIEAILKPQQPAAPEQTAQPAQPIGPDQYAQQPQIPDEYAVPEPSINNLPYQ